MPLTKLNKEQIQAAMALGGQNLVIASAGTGKTSTIVARIAHLLNKGVNPCKIVLLTFTNKAALEMIERLNRYFDRKITAKIIAGTFHSTAYKFLKEQNPKLVLKPASELKILLKSIMLRHDFASISDAKPFSPAYLYDYYQLFLSKNEQSFIDFISKRQDEQADFARIYEQILKDFEKEKSFYNYLDFNDLLVQFIKLLEQSKLHFSELLVDEYQDTNALQAKLINSFKSDSLFCVGDYDQSIYAFNGADISIIAGFKDRFKDAKIFSLRKNYRSQANILKLANKVILNNERLYPKELEVTREGDFDPPALLVFDEQNAQYQGIARQIKDLKQDLCDIAVIFRNNASADGMELALKEQGIPSCRKGSSSFFDSIELRLFNAFLSLALNPKDLMAFIHILEYSKGVGAAGAKELYDYLSKLGHGNIKKGLLNPDLSIKINSSLGLFSKKAALNSDFANHPIVSLEKLSLDCVKSLEQLYLYLREASFKNNAKELALLISDNELFIQLCAQLALKRSINREGRIDEEKLSFSKERIKDRIKAVVNLAKNYKDAYKFYNFLSLGAKELSSGKGVQLLSVHAAKGLEFHSVYVIDLAQNRFPNKKLISMGGSLEEERRLFYVAATRAKDNLYLSYAKFDAYKGIKYEPSCFLKEAGFEFKK